MYICYRPVFPYLLGWIKGEQENGHGVTRHDRFVFAHAAVWMQRRQSPVSFDGLGRLPLGAAIPEFFIIDERKNHFLCDVFAPSFCWFRFS